MTTSQSESVQPVDADYRQPEWDCDYAQQPFSNADGSLYLPPRWERLPQSMWGVLSFVFSLVGAFAFLVLVCVCTWIVLVNPEAVDMDTPHPGLALAGLGLLGCCFVQLVALVLGIVGLCESHTRKSFAIFGVFFSMMTIGLVSALIVLGVMID